MAQNSQTTTCKDNRKTTIGFVLVSLFSSMSGLLLLPLYVAYLEASEYGIWALTWLVANLAATMSNVKLDHAMRVLYFDHAPHSQPSKTLISSLLSGSFIVSFVSATLFVCLGSFFYDELFTSNQLSFYPIGFMALLSAVLNQSCAAFYALIQNQRKLKTFAMLKITVTAINLIAQVWVLTQTTHGVFGLVAVMLAAAVLNQMLVLILCVTHLSSVPSKKVLLQASKFSAPLMLFGLLFLSERQIDKLFIENILDLSDVGIYALLGSVGSTIFLFYNAMDSGFRAELYAGLSGADHSDTIKPLLKVYILPGLVLASGLLAVAGIVPLLPIAKSYGALSQYLVVFVVTLLLLPFLRWQGLVLLYEKKSSKLVFMTAIKLCFHLLLLFVLLPKFGLWGAIAALGVSVLLNNVMYHFLISKQFRHMPYLLSLSPFYLFITTSAAGLFLFSDHPWLPIFAVTQFLVFALSVLAFWFLTSRNNQSSNVPWLFKRKGRIRESI